MQYGGHGRLEMAGEGVGQIAEAPRGAFNLGSGLHDRGFEDAYVFEVSPMPVDLVELEVAELLVIGRPLGAGHESPPRTCW